MSQHEDTSNGVSFGAWLRRRRGQQGVTQERVADRLGISPATMRKLESGERKPSGQIAYLLADYLRIPHDEREAFVAFARSGQGSPDSSTLDKEGSDTTRSDAPWLHVHAHRTNLPAPLTPIIGRAKEEAEVRDYLLTSRARLVTLVGTGGVGKTRLALQVGAGLVSRFPEGVFFVDLAAVADPDMVLPTIARTLGLNEGGNRPLKEVLFDHVRDRRMLLLLDNFEQVLDAGVDIARLLEASPRLKAIVTSREALCIRGERRFTVPALAFPDVANERFAAGGHGGSIRDLQHFPAVQLFLQRAGDVTQDIALTQEKLTDIAVICATLDGLPLAIELAAARCSHHSPAEIRSALSSTLRLLVGGPRDSPPRHRTVRNTIEWSYNLLDPEEQALFRRLSIFAGGFTIEVVEAVCRDDAAADSLGAFSLPSEALLSLIDKHLVQRNARSGTASAPASPPAERFSLLEPVREYLVEQISTRCELANLRRRHADYYLSIAEAAERHFTGEQSPEWGARQVAWINTLEDELQNMRVALEWYGEVSEREARAMGEEQHAAVRANLTSGLKLATALRRVWLGRGYILEGLQWLRRFMDMLPSPLPAGDRELLSSYASALLVQARLSVVEGSTGSVRPLLEDSVRIAAGLGDKRQWAMALFNRGSVLLAEQDYAASRVSLEEGLKLFRELDDRWGIAAILEDLGSIDIESNPAGAGPLFEESLTLHRQVGELFGAASALQELGRVQYRLGDYKAASELWEEGLHVSEEIGYKSKAGNLLVLLGWAALRRHRHQQALSLLRSGLLSAHQLGAPATLHSALVGLAELACAENHFERGAKLFAAASTLAETRSLKLSHTDAADFQSAVAKAHTLTANKESWERAWHQGRRMEISAVLRYASDASD